MGFNTITEIDDQTIIASNTHGYGEKYKCINIDNVKDSILKDNSEEYDYDSGGGVDVTDVNVESLGKVLYEKEVKEVVDS